MRREGLQESGEGAPRAARARGAFRLTRDDGAALAVPRDGFLVLDGAAGAPALALEALARGDHDVVLALAAEGAHLRVNGLAAPRVAVLRAGDELALDGAGPFCVVHRRPSPFVRLDERGARAAGACALCRGAFAPGRRAYRCACGALLHADGPEVPEVTRERWDCAFGTCAACGRPVEAERGPESGEGAPA